MLAEAFNQFEADLIEWTSRLTGSNGKHPLEGPTPQKIKEMYYQAFHLYRDQQYEQACHFFRLLVAAAPSESKYWKGLAASLQMRQEHAEALNCYICAQLFNRDQPDPYLYVYAADCYFALKQVKEGLKALEAARLSAEERQDTRVLKHVALMQALWSNKCNNE